MRGKERRERNIQEGEVESEIGIKKRTGSDGRGKHLREKKEMEVEEVKRKRGEERRKKRKRYKHRRKKRQKETVMTGVKRERGKEK